MTERHKVKVGRPYDERARCDGLRVLVDRLCPRCLTPESDLDDSLVLRPRPPFRLELIVWALRRRGRNRLDRWDGAYGRALDLGGRSVTVEVAQRGQPDQPYLSVAVLTEGGQTATDRASIEHHLVRMPGLDVGLGDFYQLAERHARRQATAFRVAVGGIGQRRRQPTALAGGRYRIAQPFQ